MQIPEPLNSCSLVLSGMDMIQSLTHKVLPKFFSSSQEEIDFISL